MDQITAEKELRVRYSQVKHSIFPGKMEVQRRVSQALFHAILKGTCADLLEVTENNKVPKTTVQGQGSCDGQS
jgi:hypothetical protein